MSDMDGYIEDVCAKDGREGAELGLWSFMVGLSEELHGAQWHMGLEYELWEAVEIGAHPKLAATDIALLKALADRSERWWTWPGEDAQAVALDEWRRWYGTQRL